MSGDLVPGAAAGGLSTPHTHIYSLCKPGGLRRWLPAFTEEGSKGQSREDHSQGDLGVEARQNIGTQGWAWDL